MTNEENDKLMNEIINSLKLGSNILFNPKEQNKSWAKRFDKKFTVKPNFSSNAYLVSENPETVKKIKKFISSELSAFAKEMIEAIPETMDELSKKTEQPLTENEFAFIAGFNSALSDTRQAQMEIIKKYNINL